MSSIDKALASQWHPAHPVLRHRIITNFNAEAEGVTADKIVDRLIETIPADPSRSKVAGFPPIFKGSAKA